jgi:predicted PurR-regulated permease PerM
VNGASGTRILARIWLLTAGVVAISVLYVAKILFLPLAFAVLFAFLLAPPVGRLERLHLPRTIAAVVVISLFAALLTCAGWIFFTQLVAIANDLPTYRDNIAQKLASIHTPSNSAYSRAAREIERLGDQLGVAISTPSIPASSINHDQKPLGASPEHPVQVKEVSQKPARLDQLGGALESVTTALLSVVFTFFVLLQREDLRNRIIHLTGERNVTAMTQAMSDASARISRYFSLQLLVNTIYGAVITAVLYAIGLPHFLLFGTLAAILRFVPYIGWMGAAALPTVLSLAVFHGWQKSLIILGTFLCLEIVTGNYVEPHIYGRHTGLSSLAILVAAAFWTLLWGPVGLILSVPLTVCLVVIGQHMPALEFLTIMLGDQPAIQQWTCYYQRLLAHDSREAAEILESALRDMPLHELYDSVLIPALVKSEEDRQDGGLDDSTVRFIRRASRDFIAEFGVRETRGTDSRALGSITPANPLPISALKVLCVPVRDETDELAALMAAQVLDGSNVQAEALPVRRIDEILTAVSRQQPGVVLLCALPPFGIARSHRIYRALRALDEELRIMIGIWNYPDDPSDAAQKISSEEEEGRISTRLSEALAEVRMIAAGGPGTNAVPGESAA